MKNPEHMLAVSVVERFMDTSGEVASIHATCAYPNSDKSFQLISEVEPKYDGQGYEIERIAEVLALPPQIGEVAVQAA